MSATTAALPVSGLVKDQTRGPSAKLLRAMAIVIAPNEGVTLDRSPSDSGNWTGGAVGVGALAGTKFGISAAAYPTLNIAALTFGDAAQYYWIDYWAPCGCEDLPAPLALLVFDAAINNGPHRAIPWLQEAVGVPPDGMIGPRTRAAVAACDADEAAIEFLAQRTVFEPQTAAWQGGDALGMARRLARLPYQARQMQAAPTGPATGRPEDRP